LGSAKYKERLQAEAELFQLGDRVLPALHKALAAKPTLELRKRLEGLVDRLASWPLAKQQVRTIRAVEVLERIGTPEARELLQRLAQGAPGALTTTQAQVALGRLPPQ
jgi:hypothetical protein